MLLAICIKEYFHEQIFPVFLKHTISNKAESLYDAQLVELLCTEIIAMNLIKVFNYFQNTKYSMNHLHFIFSSISLSLILFKIYE